MAGNFDEGRTYGSYVGLVAIQYADLSSHAVRLPTAAVQL